MDTTKTQRAETRGVSGRGSAWLICMALVTVASGCGGCLQTVRDLPEAPGSLPGTGCPGGPTCGITQSLLEEIDDPKCPTGNCDPGGTGNATGVYTAEGGNYCFRAMGEQYFCPEAFINTPAGVVLDVRYLNNPGNVIKTTVSGRLSANPNQLVEVLAIHSDRTELAIKYRLQGQPQELTAKGTDLEKLVLRLGSMAMGRGDASPLIGYELKFVKQPDVKNGVHRYKLTYRELGIGAPSQWIPHCAEDAADTIAFLQERRIHALTGSIKKDPNVTTMGCELGSIVTCLDWGYTPWNATGAWDDTREYVYRSCLQAKRAAYFVGKGDFRSYTKPNTKIVKWDQYASGGDKPTPEQQVELAPHIEALWSPHGAVCFNPKNRRRGDAEAWGGKDENHLNTYGVGPCPSGEFTTQGKIFTVPSAKK